MKLTRKLIHSAATNDCGFNKDQLKLLGVEWPPKHGWLRKLVDKEVPDQIWEAVMKLSGVKQKSARAEIVRSLIPHGTTFQDDFTVLLKEVLAELRKIAEKLEQL